MDIKDFSEETLERNPELKELLASLKPASKYKNVETLAAGMTFQSGHEAVEIGKLILLEEHHHIFGLRLQVRFPLPGDSVYVADACYADDKLEFHVMDCKAFDKKTGKYLRTKEYALKRKLFSERYGRDIEEL